MYREVVASDDYLETFCAYGAPFAVWLKPYAQNVPKFRDAANAIADEFGVSVVGVEKSTSILNFCGISSENWTDMSLWWASAQREISRDFAFGHTMQDACQIANLKIGIFRAYDEEEDEF